MIGDTMRKDARSGIMSRVVAEAVPRVFALAKDKCPRRSGDLAESITAEGGESSVTLRSDIRYAYYVKGGVFGDFTVAVDEAVVAIGGEARGITALQKKFKPTGGKKRVSRKKRAQLRDRKMRAKARAKKQKIHKRDVKARAKARAKARKAKARAAKRRR